jgi:F-type H+-transporting ATPase subunit b
MIAAAQDQARAEAGKIMEETREKIKEEKEAALRDIRREVAVLSVAIAEKVVRKELSGTAGQKEMIDRIFDELS